MVALELFQKPAQNSVKIFWLYIIYKPFERFCSIAHFSFEQFQVRQRKNECLFRKKSINMGWDHFRRCAFVPLILLFCRVFIQFCWCFVKTQVHRIKNLERKVHPYGLVYSWYTLHCLSEAFWGGELEILTWNQTDGAYLRKGGKFWMINEWN